MDHAENLRNSIMVKLPIRGQPLSNEYGKYWANIGRYVLGLHDVRPRLGTFTNPWGAVSDPVFAMPKLGFINVKLSDLMDRRACELLAISKQEQRPIAVMWSGGIDSTGVLSSLVRHSDTPEQIVVYFSTESILENPVFYKNHIANKLKCEHIRNLDVTNEFISKNILVHGDPGDCLFGPSMPMYRQLLATKEYLKPWRDNRQALIDGINIGCDMPGFAEWYVNKLSDNIEEVGIYNVNNIADWWWWHYFNLKWEFSILRPFFETRKDMSLTISRESLQSYADTLFYNTADFQNWSHCNLNKLFADPKQHKMEMKQYIYELDKNAFYRDNKFKTESIAGILKERPDYIDANFKSYYLREPGVRESMVELLEQYKG